MKHFTQIYRITVINLCSIITLQIKDILNNIFNFLPSPLPLQFRYRQEIALKNGENVQPKEEERSGLFECTKSHNNGYKNSLTAKEKVI